MATLIRFSPRKGAPADPSLDLAIDGEFSIGRAPSSVVRLTDRRVRYRHALVWPMESGFTVEAIEGASLVQNGQTVQTATLAHAGDQVTIGAHALTLLAPGETGPILLIEAGPADGLGEAEVYKAYDQALSYQLPPLRRWSWAIALVVLLTMLLAPLLSPVMPRSAEPVSTQAASMAPARSAPSNFRPDRLWIVGHMSNAHAAFGQDCALCHEKPFVSVRNEACLSCHQTTGQHADAHAFPAVDLAKQSCENCHREHKGATQATSNAEADCAGCHANIKGTAQNSTLADVRDFGSAHPEFAPTVISDASTGMTKRVRMGAGVSILSQTNLRFTHGKHLIPEGIKNAEGKTEVLGCAECHKPQPGGGGRMTMPTFAENCAGCHALKFEPKHPEWRLPHGAPDELASRILGFYSQAVLSGESFSREVDPLFAKPGQEPMPAELPAAMARSQAAAAMASSVAKAACGTCHTFEMPAPGADPLAWKIRQVVVNPTFLPKARFTHAKHDTMECAGCHADIRTAQLDQVVLPGIESCRNCHVGEAPVTGKVASTCVSCHDFHQHEMPMLPKKGQTAANLWKEADAQVH
jgi:hypothetical protein